MTEQQIGSDWFPNHSQTPTHPTSNPFQSLMFNFQNGRVNSPFGVQNSSGNKPRSLPASRLSSPAARLTASTPLGSSPIDFTPLHCPVKTWFETIKETSIYEVLSWCSISRFMKCYRISYQNISKPPATCEIFFLPLELRTRFWNLSCAPLQHR